MTVITYVDVLSFKVGLNRYEWDYTPCYGEIISASTAIKYLSYTNAAVDQQWTVVNDTMDVSGRVSFTFDEWKKAIKSNKYEHIYCNVPISVPGVTHIDNACIGKYNLNNGLILIDEATIFADSREFKTFGKDKVFCCVRFV